MSLKADLHLVINTPSKPSGGVAVISRGNGVMYSAPAILTEASFPATQTEYPIDSHSTNSSGADLYQKLLTGVGAAFAQKNEPQNACVYCYGQQGTPKRESMFGPKGYASRVFFDAVAASRDTPLYLSCVIMSDTDNLVDCLKPTSGEAVIVDSVKEGPRLNHISRALVRSTTELERLTSSAWEVIKTYFAPVSLDYSLNPQSAAIPPYLAGTIIMSLVRYVDEQARMNDIDTSSLNFVALGDSERPVLCGIDVAQQQMYEKNQKILSSVAGVFQAIRNNRLRIPFGKSRLTQLLKHAYNTDRRGENISTNKPTWSLLIAHVLNDDAHAEEALHTIVMMRRLSTSFTASLGLATRDLAAEKWRLEQDSLELRDELTIARAVYDYKPCIVDQSRQINNIAEEENKRISVITRKREEVRERQLADIRARAQEVAKHLIDEEVKRTGMTLEALEQAVAAKEAENRRLTEEHNKRTTEYEAQLTKLRRRREDENSTLHRLREEIKTLEADLTERKQTLEQKRRQLEMTSEDQAKSRAAILKEREEVRAQRVRLLEERKQQHERWIAQIRETNEKVLAQIQILGKEREQRRQLRGTNSADGDDEHAEETEVQVREDIESIDRYLPKLINLEDTPQDIDTTESIRRQLESYFTQEHEIYISRLKQERERKARLEKVIEDFRSRIQESQSKFVGDQLEEAQRKEKHLQTLVDQVMQYLINGLKVRQIKPDAVAVRNFVFLSEDYKKMCICDLDESGMPISRKRPAVSIVLTNVRQVILGTYSPAFVRYSGETALARRRTEAMRNEGSYSPEVTQPLRKDMVGRYNYRSFSLYMIDGTTFDAICDTDSDWEAWILAFKSILNYKTPAEIENARRRARQHGDVSYKPPVPIASIVWGQPLDVESRDGANQLTPDELSFCRDQHVPPKMYLTIRDDMKERSQFAVVTVYDIRVCYAVDLIRAQALYEWYVKEKILPMPNLKESKDSIDA